MIIAKNKTEAIAFLDMIRESIAKQPEGTPIEISWDGHAAIIETGEVHQGYIVRKMGDRTMHIDIKIEAPLGGI